MSADGSGAGNGEWGNLVAQGGEYVPGTVDYTANPAASQVVYVTSENPQAVLSKLEGFANQVNGAGITYSPTSTNSNAFAHQAVTVLGIQRPMDIVWAPGYGSTVLNVGGGR